MKVKELIRQLKLIDKNSDIYIHECLEIYDPILQCLYDSETGEIYFILTSYNHFLPFDKD